MKITRFALKDFQQFENIEFNFTYPHGHKKAGLPLEKVCFIGPNGTGKTTLLDFFRSLFSSTSLIAVSNINPAVESLLSNKNDGEVTFGIFDGTKEYIVKGGEPLEDGQSIDSYLPYLKKNQLTLYSPAESTENHYKTISDVPKTSVSDALGYFEAFPDSHTISPETLSDFWKLLIYKIKKRDDDYKQFQELSENQDKTIREIKAVFDKENPQILKKLAALWNRLLEPAGLYFDYEHAKNPVQLTDNLLAYIKLKSTGETIPYKKLSTGIRNFIFKIGHIFSIYFNRKVKTGILLVDEPENSLFPDFLYDLVSIYEEITENTQIFMATHNPIIAAQFDPAERFILDFDDRGYVTVHRGTVPAGDDPNDILVKDFGVRSLLGKEGIKKWERYIELKNLIRIEKSPENKKELVTEYMKIGNEYNFLPERPA